MMSERLAVAGLERAGLDVDWQLSGSLAIKEMLSHDREVIAVIEIGIKVILQVTDMTAFALDIQHVIIDGQKGHLGTANIDLWQGDEV